LQDERKPEGGGNRVNHDAKAGTSGRECGSHTTLAQPATDGENVVWAGRDDDHKGSGEVGNENLWREHGGDCMFTLPAMERPFRSRARTTLVG
jgi:hypothetical protein